MKCARLHLQERPKSRIKSGRFNSTDRPRRYCQKRLVDPDHEEDPRWTDVLERFRCKPESEHGNYSDTIDTNAIEQECFMYLSVQNLKFRGDVQQRKRPRTCFKYKAFTDGKKHRLFVKHMLDESERNDEDRCSQLTYYYFDDYVKYLLNTDRSRPSSGKSSIFLYSLTNKYKENKSIQVDTRESNKDIRKARKSEPKAKKFHKNDTKQDIKDKMNQHDTNIEDAKISFHKSGKRKSLTISRTQSPETVQVIRVDVVCNYNNSSALSNYEENKKQIKSDDMKLVDKRLDNTNFKKSPLVNKYLLSNTVKSLDENVAGGAKVTLLCKTFRLSDRNKVFENKANANVTQKEFKKKIHQK